MSDEREPVGSVAEEAAKLFGALQDWAREGGYDATTAGAGAASAFRTVNEHIATGGKDCRYCPVCQAISVVRRTSPEAKQHLITAVTSFLQAAAVFMADDVDPHKRSEPQSPVEKIDLCDDQWDED